VTDAPVPDLRIGDAERTEALRALDEHLTVGRLDIDEYGERSARITTARTRGQLTELFADLPQPHPAFAGAPVPAAGKVPATRSSGHSRGYQMASALVPLSGIVAVALFFGLSVPWVIFLLPAAMAVIVGTLQSDARRRNK